MNWSSRLWQASTTIKYGAAKRIMTALMGCYKGNIPYNNTDLKQIGARTVVDVFRIRVG
jgi:hypothetical protein